MRLDLYNKTIYFKIYCVFNTDIDKTIFSKFLEFLFQFPSLDNDNNMHIKGLRLSGEHYYRNILKTQTDEIHLDEWFKNVLNFFNKDQLFQPAVAPKCYQSLPSFN